MVKPIPFIATSSRMRYDKKQNKLLYRTRLVAGQKVLGGMKICGRILEFMPTIRDAEEEIELDPRLLENMDLSWLPKRAPLTTRKAHCLYEKDVKCNRIYGLDKYFPKITRKRPFNDNDLFAPLTLTDEYPVLSVKQYVEMFEMKCLLERNRLFQPPRTNFLPIPNTTKAIAKYSIIKDENALSTDTVQNYNQPNTSELKDLMSSHNLVPIANVPTSTDSIKRPPPIIFTDKGAKLIGNLTCKSLYKMINDSKAQEIITVEESVVPHPTPGKITKSPKLIVFSDPLPGINETRADQSSTTQINKRVIESTSRDIPESKALDPSDEAIIEIINRYIEQIKKHKMERKFRSIYIEHISPRAPVKRTRRPFTGIMFYSESYEMRKKNEARLVKFDEIWRSLLEANKNVDREKKKIITLPPKSHPNLISASKQLGSALGNFWTDAAASISSGIKKLKRGRSNRLLSKSHPNLSTRSEYSSLQLHKSKSTSFITWIGSVLEKKKNKKESPCAPKEFNVFCNKNSIHKKDGHLRFNCLQSKTITTDSKRKLTLHSKSDTSLRQFLEHTHRSNECTDVRIATTKRSKKMKQQMNENYNMTPKSDHYRIRTPAHDPKIKRILSKVEDPEKFLELLKVQSELRLQRLYESLTDPKHSKTRPRCRKYISKSHPDLLETSNILSTLVESTNKGNDNSTKATGLIKNETENNPGTSNQSIKIKSGMNKKFEESNSYPYVQNITNSHVHGHNVVNNMVAKNRAEVSTDSRKDTVNNSQDSQNEKEIKEYDLNSETDPNSYISYEASKAEVSPKFGVRGWITMKEESIIPLKSCLKTSLISKSVGSKNKEKPGSNLRAKSHPTLRIRKAEDDKNSSVSHSRLSDPEISVIQKSKNIKPLKSCLKKSSHFQFQNDYNSFHNPIQRIEKLTLKSCLKKSSISQSTSSNVISTTGQIGDQKIIKSCLKKNSHSPSRSSKIIHSPERIEKIEDTQSLKPCLKKSTPNNGIYPSQIGRKHLESMEVRQFSINSTSGSDSQITSNITVAVSQDSDTSGQPEKLRRKWRMIKTHPSVPEFEEKNLLEDPNIKRLLSFIADTESYEGDKKLNVESCSVYQSRSKNSSGYMSSCNLSDDEEDLEKVEERTIVDYNVPPLGQLDGTNRNRSESVSEAEIQHERSIQNYNNATPKNKPQDTPFEIPHLISPQPSIICNKQNRIDRNPMLQSSDYNKADEYVLVTSPDSIRVEECYTKRFDINSKDRELKAGHYDESDAIRRNNKYSKGQSKYNEVCKQDNISMAKQQSRNQSSIGRAMEINKKHCTCCVKRAFQLSDSKGRNQGDYNVPSEMRTTSNEMHADSKSLAIISKSEVEIIGELCNACVKDFKKLRIANPIKDKLALSIGNNSLAVENNQQISVRSSRNQKRIDKIGSNYLYSGNKATSCGKHDNRKSTSYLIKNRVNKYCCVNKPVVSTKRQSKSEKCIKQKTIPEFKKRCNISSLIRCDPDPFAADFLENLCPDCGRDLNNEFTGLFSIFKNLGKFKKSNRNKEECSPAKNQKNIISSNKQLQHKNILRNPCVKYTKAGNKYIQDFQPEDEYETEASLIYTEGNYVRNFEREAENENFTCVEYAKGDDRCFENIELICTESGSKYLKIPRCADAAYAPSTSRGPSNVDKPKQSSLCTNKCYVNAIEVMKNRYPNYFEYLILHYKEEIRMKRSKLRDFRKAILFASHLSRHYLDALEKVYKESKMY